MRRLLIYFIPLLLSAQFGDTESRLTVSVENRYDVHQKEDVIVLRPKIPYSGISFTKAEQGFKADLQVQVRIFQDQKLTKTLTFDTAVVAGNYYNTLRDNFFTNFELTIPAESNEFTFLIFVKDVLSGRIYRDRVEHRFSPSKDKRSVLTDFQIIDTSTGNSLLTSNTRMADRDGSIKVRFKMLNIALSDSDDVQYVLKLFDQRDRMVYFRTVKDTILKQRSEMTYNVEIPKTQLKDDRYDLRFFLNLNKQVHESFNAILTFEKNFLPTTRAELFDAFEKMSYILPSDSVDHYQKADFETGLDYFQRFWLSISPSQTRNESINLMIEYFRRVAFSTKQFSSQGNNGWKTDRGRIYIKFGPPDEVQRSQFQQYQRNIEIWVYYQQRKQFLFYDRTGFNDYVLDMNSRTLENQ